MSQENDTVTVVTHDPLNTVDDALESLRPLFTRIAEECSKVKVNDTLSISSLSEMLAKEQNMLTASGELDRPKAYNLMRPMIKALEDSGFWATKRGPNGGLKRVK